MRTKKLILTIPNCMISFMEFLKREPVLFAAFSLSLITALFEPPSSAYLDYIDFKVLCCLFCLMLIISGLQHTGLFQIAATALIRQVAKLRYIAGILIGLTFFSSMIITNDVALITFIPFALIILKDVTNPNQRILILVLMTIAANVGSSLTPFGNPQNLFLFSFFNLSPSIFFIITFPIVLAGGISLALSMLLVDNEQLNTSNHTPNYFPFIKQSALYLILFFITILSVFNILPYLPCSIILYIVIYVANKKLFKTVDYGLLLTFIFFFIFIGNIQKIAILRDALISVSRNNVFVISLLASQVISNVPAAILFSGFTTDYEGLLRGVSIGGLGTVIASLASVITFKFFVISRPKESKRFLVIFTIFNVIFLTILFVITIVL